VDRYAEAVLDGGILAGPYVRLACERHFRDRQRAADERAWYQFSPARATQIIDYFEACLCLPDVVDVDGEPQRFSLLGPDDQEGFWAFVLGSLFGWVDRAGRRRYREGYIEAGKGAGKTPILGGVGLYGLSMDGERAAEIYAAASDQDQAMILFRDAVRIAEASPDVAAELEFDGGAHIWQIRHPESLSFFRTFSRESGQKSGPRPHMGLIDELHEAPNAETSTKIRAGAKRRQQPMFLEITNSGFDRTSICWQRHEHARRVVERVVEDDQLFAYVCALDVDDKPLEDPSCHPKTNPMIGITVTRDYLARQVANAKSIPAEHNNVLRLNFCVWTNQYARAIDIGKWQACQPMPTEDELVGADCFGALDLGETDDFTAWVRGWVLDDGRVAVKLRYFLPSIALERYPNRPYAQWERAGILTVTDGDVTDYGKVRAQVLEDYRADGMQSVFYDTKTARETAQLLIADGVDMVPMAQGFALHEAIKRFLSLITSGEFCHGEDPILDWMATNLVLLTGTRGEVRIAKEKAPEKIDGIAAIVMWVDGAIVRRERAKPRYEVLIVGGRA
jgi:phage terminase large subunit-like protein